MFAIHGRGIIEVDIAPQKKRRAKAAKSALRVLCQDNFTFTDPTVHKEATLSIDYRLPESKRNVDFV